MNLQTHPALALFNRVKKNQKALKSYLQTEQITCYRVYDWDMPEFPLCIDFYEGRLHISEYKTRHSMDADQHQFWLADCLEVLRFLFEITDESIFVKTRFRRQADQQYAKVSDEKNVFTVQESGYVFQVNLSDYIDTGLFLDHRPLRKKVAETSMGKHVLNLFAYTASFSVYAAMGGALTVTTVDLSSTYLHWAKENFKLNGINITRHQFLKADVKQWIQQSVHKLYDIIILDPPTLSTSTMMKTDLDVQADHVMLIKNALRHLHPHGVLYFSNNFRNFQLSPDLEVEAIIEEITHWTIPPDFRNKQIHRCWEIRKKPQSGYETSLL
jgi:23S rRNA (cytosine1962-C5)-methyltransferase